ncbi:MAG TPA: type II toxin-antitoxin system prevent-host-death family antitoxin [Solirubrobacterales bacterium]|jgi:prevent-host-death family protein|nr:type II toxin-antitoxin system prevent-host-death family antitoxin [Solirubrobacterales bacterium]
MREIEVRELATQLSSVLREVEGGESVRIVSDGRPVADIVPVMPERSEAMKKLIAEGKVTPASRPKPKGPPPRPRKTGRSASAIILAEREEER